MKMACTRVYWGHDHVLAAYLGPLFFLQLLSRKTPLSTPYTVGLPQHRSAYPLAAYRNKFLFSSQLAVKQLPGRYSIIISEHYTVLVLLGRRQSNLIENCIFVLALLALRYVEIWLPTQVMSMGQSRACLRLRLGLSLVVREWAWHGCFSLNSLSCKTGIQRTSHFTYDKC